VIHRIGKRGLGFAYKDGFRYILDNLDSDYVFEMDADFSHNPWYLPLFLHYAQSYDLVTGTRFFDRVSIKDRSLWRNVISKTTKWLVNILTDINLTDVTTGFKCFQRKMLEKIELDDIKSEGYAFQIEGSYYVRRLNGRIKEIPILFVERSVGCSKMSWRIMFEGMFLIFKLTLKRFVRNKINPGI
jgi:dolichol-phosphate mannosyltransferase